MGDRKLKKLWSFCLFWISPKVYKLLCFAWIFGNLSDSFPNFFYFFVLQGLRGYFSGQMHVLSSLKRKSQNVAEQAPLDHFDRFGSLFWKKVPQNVPNGFLPRSTNFLTLWKVVILGHFDHQFWILKMLLRGSKLGGVAQDFPDCDKQLKYDSCYITSIDTSIHCSIVIPRNLKRKGQTLNFPKNQKLIKSIKN